MGGIKEETREMVDFKAIDDQHSRAISFPS